MKRDELLLQTGIDALKSAEPETTQLDAAARNVARRLGTDNLAGLAHASVAAIETGIEGCEDVRRLLPAHRAGTLPAARSLLIEAHLRDCGDCFHHARAQSAAVDWSSPKSKSRKAFAWRPRTLAWPLAAAFALLVCTSFLYNAFWQVPPGVRAEVESIDGSAWRISDSGDRPLAPGDRLAEGDHLRTSGGAHAVLRLSDGSTVEVNERSVLAVGARGRSMTISLTGGALIVQAAKRTTGHLYVKTPDCRVAVTGTVFSVNSGIKGSRVAVLQGAVEVSHSGVDSVVHAGDQLSTDANLSPTPVAEQIAWSHDRDKYLTLMAQFALLQHRIQQIPFPQPRYSSDLLQRVPADTLLYISIPNLGEFLSEANQVFHEQLKKSPELQQWWNRGDATKTAEMDTLVDKIHSMSQYLGDDIVVVGVKESDNPGFAILADVKRPGLDTFLHQQLLATGAASSLTILDEASLQAAPASPKDQPGGFALIRQDRAIFSNRIATLKRIDVQLNSGTSGFAEGEFGKAIGSAYSRGAGIILAADLHTMMDLKTRMIHAGNNSSEAMHKSGIDGVRYLIAEHREQNGHPENRLNLQFAGAREGVASWLAAPAPIGSLQFITPNAAIAVAVLSKDPKAIADDILSMTGAGAGKAQDDLDQAQKELQINFRADLAATLGGDFLVSLDGPVLPTPSWKAVIEVHDAQRLEQTLEHLSEFVRNRSEGKQAHSIAIESEWADGQRFYSLRDRSSGTVVAQYTFAEGYMIVAPTRPLLLEALRTYASGDSLGHSAAFRALLPKDADENYSAIAYQNLTPELTPLLSQFSGETADALRQLASDARPTAICARGEESRIQVASDSHLFGFDFLTLESLMSLGNKHGVANVRE